MQSVLNITNKVILICMVCMLSGIPLIAADATLKPGETIQLGPENPDAHNFSTADVYNSQSGNAVTELHDDMWTFINAKTTTGSGSTALKYTLDLTQPFALTFSALSNVTNERSPKWSTDFIGVVLSTAEPKNIASSQVVTSSAAGFAKASVTWQHAIGLSPYGKTSKPQNVIRTTNKGKRVTDVKTLGYRGEGKANELNPQYTVSYEPISRVITVLSRNATGEEEKHETIVPSEVNELNIGLMGVIAGNLNKDVSSVRVDHLSGTYKRVQTAVDYLLTGYKGTTQEQPLAPSSYISSVKGLHISIAGQSKYNLQAPMFKNVQLQDTNRTIVAGDAGTERIKTAYQYAEVEVPIYMVDEDNHHEKTERYKAKVMPYKPYEFTSDKMIKDLKLIPAGYEVTAITQQKGMVTLDDDYNPEVTPILIHVKHQKKIEKTHFTRQIAFQFDQSVTDGSNVTLPKDITQQVTQTVETDLVTQKQTIKDQAGMFPAVSVPMIDGYAPSLNQIPEYQLTDESPITQKLTVVYHYVTKLTVPSVIDFGQVTIGSRAFDDKGVSAVTDALVGFKAPDKNTDTPSIPGTGNETDPDTPTDNTGSESTALLKIAYMSDLNFDKHEVSAKNQTYNANLIETKHDAKVAPFVQISDNRGLNAGWRLTVKQNGPFKNDKGDILKGAYVKFSAPVLKSMDGNKIASSNMTGSKVALGTDGTQMPIMTAEAGSGQGMTYGIFGTPQPDGTTDGVQMVVEGGSALASNYMTTLTWGLSAVPV